MKEYYVQHGVFSSDMSKNPLDFFITSGSSCCTLDEAGLIRKDIKKTLLSGTLPPPSRTITSVFQEALLCDQPNNGRIMKRLLGWGCRSGAGELWSSSAICWEEARPGEAGEASPPPAVGSWF